MPVVEKYKGYLIYDTREPQYQVLEGKERFEVWEEQTGRLAFHYIAYYDPLRLLSLGDKESVVHRMLQGAREEIRRKIDNQDFSDGAGEFSLRREPWSAL